MTWGNSYANQALTLQSYLSGQGASIPAIGHSNGGIVGRRYAQVGSPLKVNRLITIGAPNRGAPIIGAVTNGHVAAWVSELLGSYGDAIGYYITNDPSFSPLANGFFSGLSYSLQYLGGYFVALVANVQAFGLPTPGMPSSIASDMNPSSPFLAGLNSAGGLALEQARLSARVGIVTTVPRDNMVFRVFAADPSGWIQVRYYAQNVALLMWNYYRFNPNLVLRSNAWRWQRAYVNLFLLDLQWAAFIGAATQAPNGVILGEDADGFLPVSYRSYPGATRQIIFPTALQIRHPIQPFHATVLNQLKTELGLMGIPVRAAPPPPPPPPLIFGC